jgi:hypothetical protein
MNLDLFWTQVFSYTHLISVSKYGAYPGGATNESENMRLGWTQLTGTTTLGIMNNV